jgi:hypothetical protein
VKRGLKPAVIVVDGHGRVVVGEDKISVNGIPHLSHGRVAVRQVEHVDLTVPAVETGMVTALSARAISRHN